MHSLPANSRQNLRVRIDPSVEISFTVLRGNGPGPAALVMAGVHGDEYEGPAAILNLIEEIDPSQVQGAIIFVPVANPEAFAANARRHPVDHGDLNRSFPGEMNGTPTQKLAHTLVSEFVAESNCILSLHGWSKEYLVLPYAEYPAGSTEAARTSKAAAEALGFQFLYPYDWPVGVLGNTALARGIPIVETEVGGAGTVTREGQELYRSVILRFLDYFKILRCDKWEACEALPIFHQTISASHSGLFQSAVAVGDKVVVGQKLGVVRGLDGRLLESAIAPCDGFVGVLRILASVRAKDHLVHVFMERKDS
jgi:hypothetical protein